MKLFEPITIRGTEFRNRIVMAPMGTLFGYRSARASAYFVERSKGGVGSIIVGGFMVEALLAPGFAQDIRRLLVEPVHEFGARIAPQLWYPNRYPTVGLTGTGPEWVAPSAGRPAGFKPIAETVWHETDCWCRELTVAEIADIVDRFARAAVKAKEAGFDFVELHACHGHNLAHQFFSPLDNRRKDLYGGSLAGRMRFGLEVARAVRAAIGEDYPFFWRMSAEEGLPGGQTLDESVAYAAELKKAGVDVIDVSVGHEALYEPAPVHGALFSPRADEPMGTFIPKAEAVKRGAGVPVVGVGRINSPQIAEEVLVRGKVDFVAIGRQLLADPYWPRKVMEGRVNEIYPCLSCNSCLAEFNRSNPIRCAINASLGAEAQKTEPACASRKVLVVGAGPAGMEAALVAAQRGHQVTLMEASDHLGGQLLAASALPYKQPIKDYLAFQSGRLSRSGVQLKLGGKVTAQAVMRAKPDAVIVATGARPLVPEIQGVDGKNVVNAVDVLSGRREVGAKIVVLGGELVACECALFLARQGKKVCLTRRGPRMAAEVPDMERLQLMYELGETGVLMMTGVRYEVINRDGLVIVNRDGKRLTIPADNIVLAVGSVPEDDLAKALEGKVPAIYRVGDCVKARRIMDAVSEGGHAARQI